MQIVIALLILIGSYLVGAIPFGLIYVHIKTGQDVRQVESGRTGGTNAMRAAGFWAGAATAVSDFLKAALAAWVARWLLPDAYWIHVLAPIAAVIGHNYSIYLAERDENGRLRLHGGAGGAPSGGGAFGLWAPSLLFILPIGLFMLFVVGYASVATMSVGIVTFLTFAYLAKIGVSPWEYVMYGILAEVLLLWALRPNIKRLFSGTERRVGLFAKKQPRPGETLGQKVDD
jgi:acyl phosphate:glycerol-3-phosphate acyltransferase